MPLFASYMLSCEIQNDKIGLCQRKSVFTAFELWDIVASAPYAVLRFVSSRLAVPCSWEWGLQSREQTSLFFWNFVAHGKISWESFRFKDAALQQCNFGGWYLINQGHHTLRLDALTVCGHSSMGFSPRAGASWACLQPSTEQLGLSCQRFTPGGIFTLRGVK